MIEESRTDEARLRRMAQRQNFWLEKCRYRLDDWGGIGTYQLVDEITRDLIVGRDANGGGGYRHQALGCPSSKASYYGLNLDEVHQFLSTQQVTP